MAVEAGDPSPIPSDASLVDELRKLIDEKKWIEAYRFLEEHRDELSKLIKNFAEVEEALRKNAVSQAINEVLNGAKLEELRDVLPKEVAEFLRLYTSRNWVDAYRFLEKHRDALDDYIANIEELEKDLKRNAAAQAINEVVNGARLDEYQDILPKEVVEFLKAYLAKDWARVVELGERYRNVLENYVTNLDQLLEVARFNYVVDIYNANLKLADEGRFEELLDVVTKAIVKVYGSIDKAPEKLKDLVDSIKQAIEVKKSVDEYRKLVSDARRVLDEISSALLRGDAARAKQLLEGNLDLLSKVLDSEYLDALKSLVEINLLIDSGEIEKALELARNKRSVLSKIVNIDEVIHRLEALRLAQHLDDPATVKELLARYSDVVRELVVTTKSGKKVDLYTYLSNLPKVQQLCREIEKVVEQGRPEEALELAIRNKDLLSMYVDYEDLVRKLRAAVELKRLAEKVNEALRKGSLEEALALVHHVHPDVEKFFPEELAKIRSFVTNVRMLVELVKEDPMYVIQCLTGNSIAASHPSGFHRIVAA